MLSSLDTNIVIYALADHRNLAKTITSQKLISDLSISRSCVLSTQVLKEFANYCTKKVTPHMPADILLEYINDLAKLHLVPVDADIIMRAVKRHYASRINYYDALIVEASIAGEAKVLYSEDLQHDMQFGPLRVVNPFL